jgi:Flp pilus assembly pilin Flp
LINKKFIISLDNEFYIKLQARTFFKGGDLMLDILRDLQCDESGQGMVEYALVLGFLAAGAIIFIFALRYSIEDLFTVVTDKLINEIRNLIATSP